MKEPNPERLPFSYEIIGTVMQLVKERKRERKMENKGRGNVDPEGLLHEEQACILIMSPRYFQIGFVSL